MTTAAGTRPIALTIAGSDSSGGAGIQADLKTFSALGVYGASVITALTAQNTTGVRAVHVAPVEIVTAQIEAVFADLAVAAVKTGMLANAAVLTAVAQALDCRPGMALVVDPVMVATSGDRLLDRLAVEAMLELLLPQATLLTPNLPEAAVLLDGRPARSLAEMEEQARALIGFGCGAVLLKGGHLASSTRAPNVLATDVLVLDDGSCERIEAPWITTANTHGTGCTLSAAITAFLAGGVALPEAVRRAKAYLTAALEHGRHLRIGHGAGPVDHLHGFGQADGGRQPGTGQ